VSIPWRRWHVHLTSVAAAGSVLGLLGSVGNGAITLFVFVFFVSKMTGATVGAGTA
jgi:hypothetical protein